MEERKLHVLEANVEKVPIPPREFIDIAKLKSYISDVLEDSTRAESMISKYIDKLKSTDEIELMYNEILNDSNLHYVYVMSLLTTKTNEEISKKVEETRKILLEEMASGYKRITTYLLLLEALDK